MGKVHFIDVTNRDGVQAARVEMSKFQRTMVNYYLGKLGVFQSEFAFPFVWHEKNYVDANCELAELGALGDLVLEGWSRGVVSDVETSLRTTKVKHLNVSISTSDQMIHGKFRGTHEQEHHLHESPRVITVPLMFLAVGAIAAGWVGIPPVFLTIKLPSASVFGRVVS